MLIIKQGDKKAKKDSISWFSLHFWPVLPLGKTPKSCTLTSTAALHVSHFMEGVCQQVGEPAVQIHRRQAALVSFSGRDQSGEAAVHALSNTPDVQLS